MKKKPKKKAAPVEVAAERPIGVAIPFVNFGRVLLRVDHVMKVVLRDEVKTFSSGLHTRWFLDILYTNGVKADIEFATQAEQLGAWRLLRQCAGDPSVKPGDLDDFRP